MGPRGAWRFAMQADDEYNADIEAALDTSDEMSVGDALRRRRAHKDKRSIAKSTAPPSSPRPGVPARAFAARPARTRTPTRATAAGGARARRVDPRATTRSAA